jgi:hypothetical protein
MRSFLLPFFFLIFCLPSSAQQNSAGVPAVTADDFSPVSPLVTSETDAVILLDSGSTTISANTEDGFFTTFYQFRRILIKNKRGLEAGKMTIGFSAQLNHCKKLQMLFANTYNLENGKVKKVSLSDKDFFVDETKEDFHHEKFAFSDATEGSIIEFEYAVKHYSTELRNWYFQGSYPRLKSIYTVRLPDIFNFSILFQNKIYKTTTQTSTTVQSLYTRDFGFENRTIHTISWTYENVPPMLEQAYTSTIDNFIACVKFQPSGRPNGSGGIENILKTWPWVSNYLLNSEDFGLPLTNPGANIKKTSKKLTEDKNSELEKARALFTFVRDNMKVTGRGVLIDDNTSLDDIFKLRQGNVAEINLLLVAMLRTQKIKADPVILATRDNGLTNEVYPVLDNYNYVICRTVIDGKEWFLDASSPTMGFGKLPVECYNGHARVITIENFPVYLAPDSLLESSLTSAEIHNDPATKKWELNWTDRLGYYKSSDIRTELKDKSAESLIKSITETIPFRKSLDSFSIDNLDNLDEPLIFHFKMIMDPGDNGNIYLNPLLNFGLKGNPFISVERNYPVEMPFKSDKKFELKIEIPTGYVLEEVPKSEKFRLNESDGYYEYQVETTGNFIEIRSTMKINKAIFDSEDYNNLKLFFSNVIRKQNEMIVFKKKG